MSARVVIGVDTGRPGGDFSVYMQGRREVDGTVVIVRMLRPIDGGRRWVPWRAPKKARKR